MLALSLKNLTKTYKNGVQALKGINLDVEEGDFFALLGPNGAGKTTAIGIVTSLVNKTAGTAAVFGHDIDAELEVAKSCIGLVPQEINFNQFEAVETIVVNQAGFYGLPRCARAPAGGKVSEVASALGKAPFDGAHLVRRHETPPDDRSRAGARATLTDPR